MRSSYLLESPKHSMKLIPLRRLFPLCALVFAACAPLAQRSPITPEWHPSPNFDDRRANFVILHHTGDDDSATALATLTSPDRRVSAHYLIGRDGKVWQLVAESARAWHAGAARWGTATDLNSMSIGIELDNNGREPYPEGQIDALLSLLADIRTRQSIPRANFLGHGDIAPGRKFDPGILFPWKRLAALGFGLWCDSPQSPAPPDFDARQGLQALGYDVSRAPEALAAFRRHYRQLESSAEPDLDDKALLQCLLLQRTAR